jgi:hypothetical protein
LPSCFGTTKFTEDDVVHCDLIDGLGFSCNALSSPDKRFLASLIGIFTAIPFPPCRSTSCNRL